MLPYAVHLCWHLCCHMPFIRSLCRFSCSILHSSHPAHCMKARTCLPATLCMCTACAWPSPSQRRTVPCLCWAASTPAAHDAHTHAACIPRATTPLQKNRYEAYVLQPLETDPVQCAQRNVHGRTLEQLKVRAVRAAECAWAHAGTAQGGPMGC